jgi:hypothetical protein
MSWPDMARKTRKLQARRKAKDGNFEAKEVLINKLSMERIRKHVGL